MKKRRKKRSPIFEREKDELESCCFAIHQKLAPKKKSNIELKIFKKNWEKITGSDLTKLTVLGYTMTDIRNRFSVSSTKLLQKLTRVWP